MSYTYHQQTTHLLVLKYLLLKMLNEHMALMFMMVNNIGDKASI